LLSKGSLLDIISISIIYIYLFLLFFFEIHLSFSAGFAFKRDKTIILFHAGICCVERNIGECKWLADKIL
jgi:hypothetical protein